MLEPKSKLTAEKLAELTDEVNEFHPVLHRLFTEMPGIERVDYNQGPDELGADFILHRRDGVLDLTDHIGVVVKIGKVQTNHTEIERQVDECFSVKRKSKDGLYEIQINEVWVFVTKNITKNAKDKIYSKFSGKKIRMFPGEEVSLLLDKYVPNEFISTPPKIQKYSEEILQQVSIDDRNTLVVPGGEEFYIEPNIERLEYDHTGYLCDRKPIGGIEKLAKKILNAPLAILEGGMGVGKSKLTRELMKEFLSSSMFEECRLFPHLLHCNEFLKNYDFKADVLAGQLREKYGLDEKCRIQIILDGLDEIDILDSEKRAKLDLLLQTVANGNQIGVMIATRPADEWGLFGSRVQSLDIFRLVPLRGTKALEFLSRVGGQIDINSRIIKDIQGSKLFHSLEGTPIAFMLLGRLIAENKHDVPSNLTELFQKYLELILGRWEIAKGLRSQVEYEVAMESLTWLSQFLMENNLQEIGLSEFQSYIKTYTRLRGIDIDAELLIEKLCDRSGILFHKVKSNSVGFRHRSFCEFYYARWIHRNKQNDIEVSSKCFHPYWSNTYFFLAGHLRDCPEFINALASVEVKSSIDRFSRAINFGNFMLAAYLTPQDVISNALRLVIKDLAKLYMQIARKEIESPLSGLATIQLLCIVCMITTQQYGYRHFKYSLGESVLDLESGECSEENALALFLLDAAYKESGGDLRFDDLLEKYGESLPVPLKLAIKHESKRMREVSDRVKRMERNLRRSFKAHKGGVSEFIRRIYDVPIAKLPKPEL